MCHGAASTMGRRDSFPLLAGQHAEYLETQLGALQNGSRTGALIMPTIASRLNDFDIKAVATYLARAR
jgi:cytochrome c553